MRTTYRNARMKKTDPKHNLREYDYKEKNDLMIAKVCKKLGIRPPRRNEKGEYSEQQWKWIRELPLPGSFVFEPDINKSVHFDLVHNKMFHLNEEHPSLYDLEKEGCEKYYDFEFLYSQFKDSYSKKDQKEKYGVEDLESFKDYFIKAHPVRESVLRIGNEAEHLSEEDFEKYTSEFINRLQEEYGSNIKILDISLHLDERTPHYHVRWIPVYEQEYTVTKKVKGEYKTDENGEFLRDKNNRKIPVREKVTEMHSTYNLDKALEALGFELPYPESKPNRHNNRLINFTYECHQMYNQVCIDHGIEIETTPRTKEELKEYTYLSNREKVVRNNINKLNIELNDLQSLVTNDKGMAVDLGLEVEQKEIAIELLQDTANNLKNDIDTLKINYAALETDYNKLKIKNEDLKKRVDKLDNNVSMLKDLFIKIKDSISSLFDRFNIPQNERTGIQNILNGIKKFFVDYEKERNQNIGYDDDLEEEYE